MFEHLDALAEESGKQALLSGLRALPQDRLDQISNAWAPLPSEYLAFLKERGAGPMEDGFHFLFLDRPLDAVTEVFRDDLIIRNGAIGPVLIIGSDHLGNSFGFDYGRGGDLLEIAVDREVRVHHLAFREFVEQLITLHPQLPYARG